MLLHLYCTTLIQGTVTFWLKLCRPIIRTGEGSRAKVTPPNFKDRTSPSVPLHLETCGSFTLRRKGHKRVGLDGHNLSSLPTVLRVSKDLSHDAKTLRVDQYLGSQ